MQAGEKGKRSVKGVEKPSIEKESRDCGVERAGKGGEEGESQFRSSLSQASSERDMLRHALFARCLVPNSVPPHFHVIFNFIFILSLPLGKRRSLDNSSFCK